MIEEWKTIDWLDTNSDGKYEVSNTGKVRNIKTQRILKPGKNQYGYFMVCLGNKMYTVHRLVAITFMGKSTEGQTDIDHINGNKEDNNLTNLRWASRSENQFNRTLRKIPQKEKYIKQRLSILFNYIHLSEEELDDMIKEITNNNTLTIDFSKYKIV